MFKNNGIDYAFETRADRKGNIGILESFKTILRGDEITLNMTLCMDMTGKITKPAYLDRIEGFKPLSLIVCNEETALAFDKSNRAEFSMLSDVAIIADVILKVDKNTRKVNMEKSKINFYMPRQYVDGVNKGKNVKCVTCDRLVPTHSNVDEYINPQIYQGYVNAFISQLEKKIDNRIDLNLLRIFS